MYWKENGNSRSTKEKITMTVIVRKKNLGNEKYIVKIIEAEMWSGYNFRFFTEIQEENNRREILMESRGSDDFQEIQNVFESFVVKSIKMAE